MAKAGRPKADITKEMNICFRVTKDEYDRLKAYALAQNRTVTKVLHECVADLIGDVTVQDLQSDDERRSENGVKKGSKRQGASKGGTL